MATGGAAKREVGAFFAGKYDIERSLGEGDRKRAYLARDKHDAAACRSLAGNA